MPLRTVILDLDGTLYGATAQYRLYGKLLTDYLPRCVRGAYRDALWALNAPDSPVRLGRHYDPDTDTFRLLPEWTGLEQAWDGRGRPLHSVPPPGPRTFAVGDPWWRPPVLATRLGLRGAPLDEAFQRVRARMLEPDFPLAPVPGLREVLSGLKGRCRRILLSNTEKRAGGTLISRLGLQDCFDDMHFRARKPVGMRALIGSLPHSPGETLTVGDNLFHDILPAQALGARTVYVGPEADFPIPGHRIPSPWALPALLAALR